jgi:uncharacterized protein YndB with AHSA1/START domain
MLSNKMNTLEFKIAIGADREKVWDTMLDPATYKEWTNETWPDSTYEGEWKQGEKISKSIDHPSLKKSSRGLVKST